MMAEAFQARPGAHCRSSHWTTRLGRGLLCLTVLGPMACSGGITDSEKPRTLTVEDVAGTWEVAVATSSSCYPNFIPELTLEMNLVVHTVTYYARVPGRVFFGGRWSQAGEGIEYWIEGWLDTDVNRLRLLLWQEVDGKGSVLEGKVYANGVFQGTLSEPIPAGQGGFGDPYGGFPGAFTKGSCTWSATGSRVAP